MPSFMNTIADKCGVEVVTEERFKSCRYASCSGDDIKLSQCCSADGKLREKMYQGNRKCLKTILLQDNGRMLRDFAALPRTAKWKFRLNDGILVPSLEDNDNVYALMPDSANVSPMFKALIIPDPDDKGPSGFPTPRDYCEDMWFEECDNGGMYVLGIDDNVYVMYLDARRDLLSGRYTCSRTMWDAMWLRAFGSLRIDNTTLEKKNIEIVSKIRFNSLNYTLPCEDGVSFSEWCEISEEDEKFREKLYLGNRKFLTTILTRNRGCKQQDFAKLPSTARWILRNIDSTLIPSLEDDCKVYALMPDSGKVCKIFKSLEIPDPDDRGPSGFPTPRDYCEDMWFEECDDGGMYVLGIDDNVYIMYMDARRDLLCGRYTCSREMWEVLWLRTFGKVKVNAGIFL